MPTLDGTDRCKSPKCQASILWVTSVNGRPMCVDYLPHVDGNIAVETDPETGERTGTVLTGFDLLDPDRAGRLYRHHRASCMDPDYHLARAGRRR